MKLEQTHGNAHGSTTTDGASAPREDSDGATCVYDRGYHDNDASATDTNSNISSTLIHQRNMKTVIEISS